MSCWLMQANKDKLRQAAKNEGVNTFIIRKQLDTIERMKGHDEAERVFESMARGERLKPTEAKQKKREVAVAYA